MNLLKSALALGGLAAALAGYSPESMAQMRVWGTYYGGSATESGSKVATDAAGNVYVAGWTSSLNAIVTPNSFDSIKTKPFAKSGYLAKFNTNGKLVWATYYGDGTKDAQLKDLGVDNSGNVYVLGETDCAVLGLATLGAFQSECKGIRDMYLAKFDLNGKRLWGTYFGGPGGEAAGGLSVMANGTVYFIGNTTSSQGIASAMGADKTLGGTSDAVVAKFTTQGALSWSRYLGGEKTENGTDISCRAFTVFVGEKCFITGDTMSTTGIAVGNSHDATFEHQDAFVAQLFGTTGGTAWSTYYGGDGGETGYSIVVDKDLNAYVAGFTYSSDLGATPGAFDDHFECCNLGSNDMFVAKFNVAGARLAATYFGDEGDDFALDLALDANNRLYLLGSIQPGFFPEDGPATPGAFDTTLGGGQDAIIAKFNASLGLISATYYGGASSEMEFYPGGGIAIGKDNHIYVIGDTESSDAIATPGSHKISLSGTVDAFLAELIP